MGIKWIIKLMASGIINGKAKDGLEGKLIDVFLMLECVLTAMLFSKKVSQFFLKYIGKIMEVEDQK